MNMTGSSSRMELLSRPWAQAEHGGADADADEALLGDRRVADPLRAELLEQAGGDLVGAFEDADLLAHQEDVLVALQLLAEGVVERLAVGYDGHASFRADAG